MPELDQALAALLTDLEQRGLLARTLVMVSSEFGRTPKINATAGRDHWPKVFSVMLAGGGIKGGMIYGTSNATASEPDADPVSPADLATTMYHQLGIVADKQLMAAGNRPIEIVDGGKVIKAAARVSVLRRSTDGTEFALADAGSAASGRSPTATVALCRRPPVTTPDRQPLGPTGMPRITPASRCVTFLLSHDRPRLRRAAPTRSAPHAHRASSGEPQVEVVLSTVPGWATPSSCCSTRPAFKCWN